MKLGGTFPVAFSEIYKTTLHRTYVFMNKISFCRDLVPVFLYWLTDLHGHMHFKFSENVYKGCHIGYTKFGVAVRCNFSLYSKK